MSSETADVTTDANLATDERSYVAESTAQRLTAVVPAYGVEKYLAACIRSLLVQECLLEALIVIDASPDRSALIAEEYAAVDPRIKVIQNETNLGLGASRNVGLRAASGEYVVFIDSDDLVAEGALDQMVASLESSGSDLATSCADEFGREPTRRRYWTVTDSIFREGATATSLRENPSLIRDHTAWTKVFRTSFLKAHDLAWAERTKCEDVVMATQAYCFAGAVDIVPIVSYLYRRRPGSITTDLAADATLGDWGRQTLLALREVERHAPWALESFASKAITVEVQSRLGVVAKMQSQADQQATEQAIRALLAHADDEILAGFPAPSIRVMLDLFTDEETPAGLALHAAGRGITETTQQSEPGPSVSPDASGVSPLLSVVMPTHNVSIWVEEAIRSVLDQTLQSLELIVVDDHSTDDTWQRITALCERDERARVLSNPGVGGAQARNFGAQLAKGEYLVFVDGDDIVPTHAYAHMVEALRASGDQMLVADYQKFWPTSTWKNSQAFGFDQHLEHTTLAASPRLIGNRTCWNRLFTRAFWEAERLHFPSAPRGNDILPMTAAMARARAITVLPEIVYHYRARLGGASMTARLSEASSLVGYFRQELLCALIAGGGGASPLRSRYWAMALGADGWAHLCAFFQNIDRMTDSDREAVSRAVTQLWDLSPQDAREYIGSRKALVYLLVAANEVDLAQSLWLSHQQPGGKTRARAAETLRALVALPAPELVKDLVTRIVHDEVIRNLVDDVSEWRSYVASDLTALAAELHQRVDLRDAAYPETCEGRFTTALLSGDPGLLWRETRKKHIFGTVKLIGSSQPSGGLRLVPQDVSADATFVRYELVEATTDKHPVRLPVSLCGKTGTPPDLVLDRATRKLLKERSWRLTTVWQDTLGEFGIPATVKLPAAPKPSPTSGSTPTVREPREDLSAFAAGRERVKHAASWRISKLKRKIKKKLKSKGARR